MCWSCIIFACSLNEECFLALLICVGLKMLPVRNQTQLRRMFLKWMKKEVWTTCMTHPTKTVWKPPSRLCLLKDVCQLIFLLLIQSWIVHQGNGSACDHQGDLITCQGQNLLSDLGNLLILSSWMWRRITKAAVFHWKPWWISRGELVLCSQQRRKKLRVTLSMTSETNLHI